MYLWLERESQIFEALQGVKADADNMVLHNTNMMDNESFFEKQMIRFVINQFYIEQKIKLDSKTTKQINQLIVNEYMNEFHGRTDW